LYLIKRKLEVYLYPHCDIEKEILLPFQVEGSQNKQNREGNHEKEMGRRNRRKP
jgi:hypothetical protein